MDLFLFLVSFLLLSFWGGCEDLYFSVVILSSRRHGNGVQNLSCERHVARIVVAQGHQIVSLLWIMHDENDRMVYPVWL